MQGTLDRRFGDPESGGYFNSALGSNDVLLRLKAFTEDSTGSVNSLAALNLFRLSVLLGDTSFRTKGFAILQASREKWTEAPWRMPHMLQSLEWAITAPTLIWLVGNASDTEFRKLLGVA